MAGATLVWLGLGLYQNYRSDASLRRQLLDLQYQTQALQGQDRAQSQELGAAGSSAAQAEIARADGLSPAGEQVYVIESPLRASGPGPLEQGIGLVAQSLGGMARSLAPTPTVAGSSPP